MFTDKIKLLLIILNVIFCHMQKQIIEIKILMCIRRQVSVFVYFRLLQCPRLKLERGASEAGDL